MGRIVIAGGTGFVGKKLIKKLANEHHDIIVLTRSASQSKTPMEHIKFVQWGQILMNGSNGLMVLMPLSI
ncbi:MAG: NAD(P)-dependent oxidoreductase [Ignavibacteria bacterium]|nr:NAD(P)-dependent oxidoreductase [Ignavibacteria bacterium]